MRARFGMRSEHRVPSEQRVVFPRLAKGRQFLAKKFSFRGEASSSSSSSSSSQTPAASACDSNDNNSVWRERNGERIDEEGDTQGRNSESAYQSSVSNTTSANAEMQRRSRSLDDAADDVGQSRSMHHGGGDAGACSVM